MSVSLLCGSEGSDRDRGQVAPLLALFAVAIGLACLGLGKFGGAAVDAASARTAADASALAGAADGEDSARRLAEANGGELVRFESAGDDVRVAVVVGDAAAVTARARASSGRERSGVPLPSGAGGLSPAVRAALARAEQLLSGPVPITSGRRTEAEQAALWRRRASNRFPVAPPGSSMHERGMAIDVPPDFSERLAAVSSQTGLCRPYPRTDAVHFELCARRLPAGSQG